MPTVPRKVVEHNHVAHRLHELFMELVQVTGLVEPDRTVPGEALSMSQAFALHELDTGAAMSQRDLAERLHLEKSTVSRLVGELEQQGLVSRERDPDNRRTYHLRITATGRAMHRALRHGFDAQFAHWVAALTPAERDGLLTGLPALIGAIRAHAGAPSHTPHAAGRP